MSKQKPLTFPFKGTVSKEEMDAIVHDALDEERMAEIMWDEAYEKYLEQGGADER